MTAVLVLAVYLAGLPRNPPGFFIDEASIAYNALTMARHGVDEHGARFPLYFKAFGEYKNPVYIYALALVFLVIGPGILAARVLSALFGVATALILGRLAWMQTRSPSVALLTIGSAALTPGVFEISRLVFEAAAFPLAVALFLLAAYRAYEGKPRVVALVATLALVTYTYTAGRILGPAFALLLAILLFRRWRVLIAVWLLYALALVPFFVWNAKSGGALTSRPSVLVENDRTTTIARNYLANASPVGLVWRGDFNARHHVPHSGGPVLLITFVLALAAAIAIRNRWIAFLICAALASIVPPAVAVEVGHALRLSALFVILLALSIPALQRWRAAAIAMVILGVLQAAFFFYVFHTTGASRGPEFNAGIQELVDDALDQGQRPVYLDAGPGAIFALWFGELHGAHRSSFALLEPGQTPPPGSIYIGGASPRPDSEVVGVHGIFGVHRIVPRVNAP